jgi:hypothetical protein
MFVGTWKNIVQTKVTSSVKFCNFLPQVSNSTTIPKNFLSNITANEEEMKMFIKMVLFVEALTLLYVRPFPSLGTFISMFGDEWFGIEVT